MWKLATEARTGETAGVGATYEQQSPEKAVEVVKAVKVPATLEDAAE